MINNSRWTRLLLAVGSICCVVTPSLLLSAPAHAGNYAYWSYWHDTGDGWKYSGCGAYYSQGDCVPANATIEGWRFTISSEGGARAPRYSGGFAQICGSSAPANGTKRVAIVVDYGSQPDAPHEVQAKCATGNASDNGGALLASQYAITSKEGFVCTINSYPKSGCGDYVGDTPSATPSPQHSARPTTSAPPTAGSTPPSLPPATSTQAAASAQAIPSPSVAPSPRRSALPSFPGSQPPVVIGGAPTKTSHGSPTATLVGLAVVAAAGGAAFIASRRRRSP